MHLSLVFVGGHTKSVSERCGVPLHAFQIPLFKDIARRTADPPYSSLGPTQEACSILRAAMDKMPKGQE